MSGEAGKTEAESIILEEEIDPNYVPSEDEVIEYAKWLGMDLEKDRDLFWIAREGLKAPLPEHWKPCKTSDTEEIYYFNFQDGKSTWDHPCDEFYRDLYEKHKKEKLAREAGNSEKKKKEQDDVAELLGKKRPKKQKRSEKGDSCESLGSLNVKSNLDLKPLPGIKKSGGSSLGDLAPLSRGGGKPLPGGRIPLGASPSAGSDEESNSDKRRRKKEKKEKKKEKEKGKKRDKEKDSDSDGADPNKHRVLKSKKSLPSSKFAKTLNAALTDSEDLASSVDLDAASGLDGETKEGVGVGTKLERLNPANIPKPRGRSIGPGSGSEDEGGAELVSSRELSKKKMVLKRELEEAEEQHRCELASRQCAWKKELEEEENEAKARLEEAEGNGRRAVERAERLAEELLQERTKELEMQNEVALEESRFQLKEEMEKALQEERREALDRQRRDIEDFIDELELRTERDKLELQEKQELEVEKFKRKQQEELEREKKELADKQEEELERVKKDLAEKLDKAVEDTRRARTQEEKASLAMNVDVHQLQEPEGSSYVEQRRVCMGDGEEAVDEWKKQKEEEWRDVRRRYTAEGEEELKEWKKQKEKEWGEERARLQQKLKDSHALDRGDHDNREKIDVLRSNKPKRTDGDGGGDDETEEMDEEDQSRARRHDDAERERTVCDRDAERAAARELDSVRCEVAAAKRQLAQLDHTKIQISKGVAAEEAKLGALETKRANAERAGCSSGSSSFVELNRLRERVKQLEADLISAREDSNSATAAAKHALQQSEDAYAAASEARSAQQTTQKKLAEKEQQLELREKQLTNTRASLAEAERNMEEATVAATKLEQDLKQAREEAGISRTAGAKESVYRQEAELERDKAKLAEAAAVSKAKELYRQVEDLTASLKMATVAVEEQGGNESESAGGGAGLKRETEHRLVGEVAIMRAKEEQGDVDDKVKQLEADLEEKKRSYDNLKARMQELEVSMRSSTLTTEDLDGSVGELQEMRAKLDAAAAEAVAATRESESRAISAAEAAAAAEARTQSAMEVGARLQERLVLQEEELKFARFRVQERESGESHNVSTNAAAAREAEGRVVAEKKARAMKIALEASEEVIGRLKAQKEGLEASHVKLSSELHQFKLTEEEDRTNSGEKHLMSENSRLKVENSFLESEMGRLRTELALVLGERDQAGDMKGGWRVMDGEDARVRGMEERLRAQEEELRGANALVAAAKARVRTLEEVTVGTAAADYICVDNAVREVGLSVGRADQSVALLKEMESERDHFASATRQLQDQLRDATIDLQLVKEEKVLLSTVSCAAETSWALELTRAGDSATASVRRAEADAEVRVHELEAAKEARVESAVAKARAAEDASSKMGVGQASQAEMVSRALDAAEARTREVAAKLRQADAERQLQRRLEEEVQRLSREKEEALGEAINRERSEATRERRRLEREKEALAEDYSKVITGLRKQLRELNQEMSEAVGRKQDELKRMKLDLEDSQVCQSQAQNAKLALQKELDRLGGAVGGYDVGITSIDALAQVESRLRIMGVEKEELESRLVRLQKENAGLTEENGEIERHRMGLERGKLELLARLEESERVAMESSVEQKRLETASGDARTEMEAAAKKIVELETQVQGLRWARDEADRKARQLLVDQRDHTNQANERVARSEREAARLEEKLRAKGADGSIAEMRAKRAEAEVDEERRLRHEAEGRARVAEAATEKQREEALARGREADARTRELEERIKQLVPAKELAEEQARREGGSTQMLQAQLALAEEEKRSLEECVSCLQSKLGNEAADVSRLRQELELSLAETETLRMGGNEAARKLREALRRAEMSEASVGATESTSRQQEVELEGYRRQVAALRTLSNRLGALSSSTSSSSSCGGAGSLAAVLAVLPAEERVEYERRRSDMRQRITSELRDFRMREEKSAAERRKHIRDSVNRKLQQTLAELEREATSHVEAAKRASTTRLSKLRAAAEAEAHQLVEEVKETGREEVKEAQLRLRGLRNRLTKEEEDLDERFRNSLQRRQEEELQQNFVRSVLGELDDDRHQVEQGVGWSRGTQGGTHDRMGRDSDVTCGNGWEGGEGFEELWGLLGTEAKMKVKPRGGKMEDKKSGSGNNDPGNHSGRQSECGARVRDWENKVAQEWALLGRASSFITEQKEEASRRVREMRRQREAWKARYTEVERGGGGKALKRELKEEKMVLDRGGEELNALHRRLRDSARWLQQRKHKIVELEKVVRKLGAGVGVEPNGEDGESGSSLSTASSGSFGVPLSSDESSGVSGMFLSVGEDELGEEVERLSAVLDQEALRYYTRTRGKSRIRVPDDAPLKQRRNSDSEGSCKGGRVDVEMNGDAEDWSDQENCTDQQCGPWKRVGSNCWRGVQGKEYNPSRMNGGYIASAAGARTSVYTDGGGASGLPPMYYMHPGSAPFWGPTAGSGMGAWGSMSYMAPLGIQWQSIPSFAPVPPSMNEGRGSGFGGYCDFVQPQPEINLAEIEQRWAAARRSVELYPPMNGGSRPPPPPSAAVADAALRFGILQRKITKLRGGHSNAQRAVTKHANWLEAFQSELSSHARHPSVTATAQGQDGGVDGTE